MISWVPMACAYWLQERVHGDLKPATHRYLMISGRRSGSGQARHHTSIGYQTRHTVDLGFAWLTYEVIVTSGGVLLNGEPLKSLTEAAHKITGAKWVRSTVLRIGQGRARQ